MIRLERLVHDFVQDLTLGSPPRRPRQRPETLEPGERARLPSRRLLAAYLLALALPAATAVVMIPFRAEHAPVAAIVLVAPVVLIAVLGATGPALAAALTAGLAYDLFLTEPYYQLVIDDPDDITATVTLLAVGMTVGLLNSRLVRVAARDATRRNELRHLLQFVRTATVSPTLDKLTTEACAQIAAVLDLRECRWNAGYHGTNAPVLLPDGNIMGYITALNPDRAKLPDHVELPASVGNTELGRFILTARAEHPTSAEERLTAATIAALYAAASPSHPRQ
jgi:K+-sensing histidine kinase KdpD